MTDYCKMKVLLGVYNDIKVLVKYEAKYKKDKKNKAKYIRMIKKKNAVIDVKLKVYKNFEKNNKNKIINAYVTFRSMEGKQRALKAFADGYFTRGCKSIFCCKFLEYSRKRFLGKWIKVKEA